MTTSLSRSKYLKWYASLCTSGNALALSGCRKPKGFDAHHIVPRSLGGSDAKANIAWLSMKAHFVAHLLLFKIDPSCVEMQTALWFMLNANRKEGAKVTGRVYAQLRATACDKARATMLKRNADPVFRATLEDSIRRAISKQVTHVASGLDFPSARAAAAWCKEKGFSKASHTNIVACCKGKKHIAYGSCWVYKGGSVETAPRVYIGKAVKAEGVSERFSSVAEAVRYLKLNGCPLAVDSNIIQCCKGTVKSAYGYSWRYA